MFKKEQKENLYLRLSKHSNERDHRIAFYHIRFKITKTILALHTFEKQKYKPKNHQKRKWQLKR